MVQKKKKNNSTKDGFHRWVGNVMEQLSEVLELCVFVCCSPVGCCAMAVVINPSAEFACLFPKMCEQLCGLESVLRLTVAPKSQQMSGETGSPLPDVFWVPIEF